MNTPGPANCVARPLSFLLIAGLLVACGSGDSGSGGETQPDAVEDVIGDASLEDGSEDGSEDGGQGDAAGDGGSDLGADGGCTDNSQCNDDVACTVDECGSDGRCSNEPQDGLCNDDDECTIDACDAVDGCLDPQPDEGADCGDGGDVCDPEGACVECIDDAADAGQDSGCAPATPICDDDACVECVGDADCGDDLYCQDGVCVGCTTDRHCDDGLDCTIDSCNLDDNTCVHDGDDSVCDDDRFCNGAESCSPEDDRALADGCLPGAPPVLGDGVSCTRDRCDDGADEVVHEADDDLCLGESECVASHCDDTLGCQSNSVERGAFCEYATAVCDGGGACIDCIDSDDGDGVDDGCGGSRPFCVGGACVGCRADADDCSGILECEEGVCMGCRWDRDCKDNLSCTNDSCDPDTGLCHFVPSDVYCDDGAYCSGTELCRPESAHADGDGCISVDAPIVDDGVECTVDSCDEDADAVRNVPNDDACSDDGECARGVCRTSVGCAVEPTEGVLCDDQSGVCDGAGECVACRDTTVGGVDQGCSESTPTCDDGECVACTDESDACPLDCEGTPGGPAQLDACGVCDDDPANDCIEDCGGVPCVECDGSDPEVCDDGNPCTADSCVDGLCEWDGAPHDDDSCEDHDVCSVTSSCLDGECVADEVLVCVGLCQSGECDPVDGCLNADEGTECDDREESTTLDVCDGFGRCQGRCDDPDDLCTHSDWGHVGDGAEVCYEDISFFAPCGPRDACGMDVCSRTGVCQTIALPGCHVCEEHSDCDSPCETGVCLEGGTCENIPSGGSCDDGLETTLNDTCDDDGICAGHCPELECGSWMRDAGGECWAVVVGSLFGGVDCPSDGDPCTRDYCDAGTCAYDLVETDTVCEHACGEGVCSEGGECQLTDDLCDERSPTCWSSQCSEDETECVRLSRDPTCEIQYAVCHEKSGLCQTGECGDDVCVGIETSCNATSCTNIEERTCDDCVSGLCDPYSQCDEVRYRDRTWPGAWRAHQSIAYGFPVADAHQTESFTTMLDDGVRWLHLIVDYCAAGADGGPLCLCEDDDTCPTSSTPFEERLDEIGTWMTDNPTAIVTLYLDEHVQDRDLRGVVEASLAEPFLYLGTATRGAYEPFFLNLSTMVRKNRRLVIFGGGFLPFDNVFLGTDFEFFDEDEEEEEDVPIPGLGGAFDLNLGDSSNAWFYVHDRCHNSVGQGPDDVAGFGGVYAVRHGEDDLTSDWAGAACENVSAVEHRDFCKRSYPLSTVFFDFYNSAHAPLTVGGGTSPYADRCIDNVTPCSTDDDCDVGTCGGFFICLTCESDEDCSSSQYCDHYWGTCLSKRQDGLICSTDAMCQSNSCDILCHSCEEHEDCTGNRWCDAFGGCQPPKANGFGCVTDVECASGACYAAFCVECNSQNDCDSGTFCNLALAGESACVDQRDTGQGCIDNFECLTGNCHAATCSECDNHEDCEDTEYCNLDILPPIESICVDKVGEGDGCVGDIECLTGRCHEFTCLDNCEQHSDCGEDRWCDPADVCRDQWEIGHACFEPHECLSGACALGFCAVCDSQDDCESEDQYCDLANFGASDCVDEKANGATCGSNVECATGNCHALTCSECDHQDDCESDEYCTLDVIPPIHSTCEPKKDNGVGCGSAVECTSGSCTVFICGECSQHDHCEGNEFCDAFGYCQDKLARDQGVCAGDVECLSGHCQGAPLGTCRECTSHGHCDSDDHCNLHIGGNFRCASDLSDDQTNCRADDAYCQSGICDTTTCRECVGGLAPEGCTGATYCEDFDCVAQKGEDATCASDVECRDGMVCRFIAGEARSQCRYECSTHATCEGISPSDSRWCNGDVCFDKFGNGYQTCGSSVECQSNVCDAGTCVECLQNSHCGGDEPYCRLIVGDLNYCVECLQNSHCPSSDFCNDSTERCQDDRSSGSSCSFSGECTSKTSGWELGDTCCVFNAGGNTCQTLEFGEFCTVYE